MPTKDQKTPEPREPLEAAFDQMVHCAFELEDESRLATTAVMRLFLRRRKALVAPSSPGTPT